MRTAAPRESGINHKEATHRPGRSGHTDAIALLKADHRQVATWFKQYEHTRSADRKQALATRICSALKIHTEIEEEIFYPAFLECIISTVITVRL